MSNVDDLRGCGTALVTPFQADGSLDLAAYRRLVSWQIEEGIDFLVPCGTTGESVTLDDEEYSAVVGACVEAAAGAVAVVAGAGSNDTAKAARLSRLAEAAGADALLSVSPYYNRPTQEGMVQHFQEIARHTSLPMIVYNVPGRTGTNILPDTQLRLAELPSVLGVKEASGSLAQIMEVLARRPGRYRLYSGDDNLAFAFAALGGEGLISVASNVIPGPMSRMLRRLREGRLEEARALHYRYLDLMNLNFVESNPIPVKYALHRLGRLEHRYRLPLCPMSPANQKRMDAELDRLELVTA